MLVRYWLHLVAQFVGMMRLCRTSAEPSNSEQGRLFHLSAFSKRLSTMPVTVPPVANIAAGITPPSPDAASSGGDPSFAELPFPPHAISAEKAAANQVVFRIAPSHVSKGRQVGYQTASAKREGRMNCVPPCWSRDNGSRLQSDNGHFVNCWLLRLGARSALA